MTRIFSLLLIAASLAFLSCDTGGSDSIWDQDSGEDTCDQKLMENIETTSILCTNWNALGYLDYADCRSDQSDRLLTLFLVCKVDEKDSDEDK